MLDKKELNQVEKIVADTMSNIFKTDLFPFLQEKFESIDKQFSSIDKRFEAIDKRFDASDEDHKEIFERLDRIEKKYI